MLITKVYSIFVLMALASCSTARHNIHEQVHIALGTNETEMMVTWVTMANIKSYPRVEYGRDKVELNQVAKGESIHFKENKTNFYTHRVLMTNLKPKYKYFYRVGNHESGWSDLFKLYTLSDKVNWSPSIAVVGDMGLENARSLPFLKKDVRNRKYDVIFHIGDMAYNLESGNGQTGHKFMSKLEKVASQVPYMVCPGNHERYDNFSHYDARFSMIGDRHQQRHNSPQISSRINNHFYSLDIGPAHIIMYSTEYYYYCNLHGWEPIKRQYQFLKNDLEKANANRHKRPWIIVMGHRPMYCLKTGDPSCDEQTQERKAHRKGIHWKGVGKKLEYGLEKLFYRYGVDLQLYGHEHYYARLLPIYDFSSTDSLRDQPYNNPHGPVHITTGNGGCWEELANFTKHPKEWVDVHKLDYGYTRIRLKSRHQIVLEQISVDKEGQIIDRIELIKDGPRPRWMK